ncbi:MAG TPA: hypothetical protein VMR21_00800 [Vicinamibacteria bacterium]|nr:hypothetical protein [Vicinamibacteria bacterium]
MLKLLLAGAVAVPVATAGAVAATGVVVVDVREPGDGLHLVIPVPLALAQTAAAFVPADKARVHLPPEARRYLPMARAALRALEDAEDAELVRVEEPGQVVSIRKEGGLVHVRVQDGEEEVNVQVPLALAMYALESGDRFTASEAVWALQSARLTRLVDVRGRDGQRVKVTVY